MADASEQGGVFFLETTAVVKIFFCFASYACCIRDLFFSYVIISETY